MSAIEIPIGLSSAPRALCLTMVTRGARERCEALAGGLPAWLPATAPTASSGSATRAMLRLLGMSCSIDGTPFGPVPTDPAPGRLHIGAVPEAFKAENRLPLPATGRNRTPSDQSVGNFGDDHRDAPSDGEEQRGRDAKIDGAVQPMGEPPVLKKAEQIDVPLVGVGHAVEEDHHQREFVQVEQDRAARL